MLTNHQAQKLGENILDKVQEHTGIDFSISVWENMGWHCQLEAENVRIYISPDNWSDDPSANLKFSCWIQIPIKNASIINTLQIISEQNDDPLAAYDEAVSRLKEFDKDYSVGVSKFLRSD